MTAGGLSPLSRLIRYFLRPLDPFGILPPLRLLLSLARSTWLKPDVLEVFTLHLEVLSELSRRQTCPAPVGNS